jgi:DNA polymerase-3 subunit delta'
MLALERVEDDKGKIPTVIPVDMVRKTIGFFGSTAGEGGWRVCIVDSADELNAAGANALLKTLEEPPARALLLVVSHAPGRLLPTIRSRCRRLALRPLSADDVARAAADALARNAGEADIKAAATASDGSVARALDLLAGTALQVRDRVSTMLAALPAVDPRDLHALGDALGRDDSAFTAFVDAVRDWLSARVTVAGAEPSRLARMAEVWEKLNTAARDVEIFHLERKPFAFNVFGWLAAATRG